VICPSEEGSKHLVGLICRAYLELLRLEPALLKHDFALIHQTVRRCATRSIRQDAESASEIVEAVDRACVFYPKEVFCLQRSAAATCLLRKLGIPAEMAIGIQHRPFRAHAWVEIGGRIANDKPYVTEIYTVLDRC